MRERWRTTRTLDFVARISYPLYVVHNIVGLAVLRILQERGWNAATAFGVAVAIATGLAWMVHRGVELPTQQLGRRWGQRLRSERVTSLP